MSIITKEMLNNVEHKNQAKAVNWEISSILKNSGIRSNKKVTLVSYLLFKACEYNDKITFDYITDNKIGLDESVILQAKEYLTTSIWNDLTTLLSRHNPESFAIASLLPIEETFDDPIYSTPQSVVELSKRILEISSNDKVADLGCGVGEFIISASSDSPNASYNGFEINVESAMISKIRAELIASNVNIELMDVFALANESGNTYTKIFSNYPFGVRLKNLESGAEFIEKIKNEFPDISKATSSDWIYNALLCDLLEEEGKAIGIMTNGSTWNSIDKGIRQYFVEKGLVECVIALPSKLFGYTNISTTMIVMSHHNNKVRMVDATHLYQKGRRRNEFSDSDISTIIDYMNSDSQYSRYVEFDELRNNEYALSFSRYVPVELKFDNGIPFESIIKRISRGAHYTAKELDEIVTNKVTNMQYLMLANIQNGIIEKELPYLSKIDPKFEKYCLKDRDLIISKNGYPYKVAIASVLEGQKILANGNLYIIEIDEEKADPYYIKAFFESEKGIATLKSISVGASILNIGVDKLKKIMIPLPPLEEQKRIAEKYQAKLDEIAILKLRLEKATNELKNMFDKESEQ